MSSTCGLLTCTFLRLPEKTRKEMTAKGSSGMEVILAALEVSVFSLYNGKPRAGGVLLPLRIARSTACLSSGDFYT